MSSNTKSILVFYVNGKKIVDGSIQPEWTLLFYLRNKLRLCGTKLGCGEGGCGACTVMVSKYDRTNSQLVHFPVNACLAPVCSMHGLAVTTIEGIGSTKSKLHPVQERIAKSHGSQCGFCTPGIVMSMYTLLRAHEAKPNMKDMEVAFQGNLCRCTGYRPIIEGYKTFTEEWELQRANGTSNGCSMGSQCCQLQPEPLFETSEFIPYDQSQEPIFPPELKLSDCYDRQYLVITGENVTWYRPTTLAELLRLKKQYPHAKIVVGNTEIGVETKFKHMTYPILIQPSMVPEMTEIREQIDGISIGASTTLIDLEKTLRIQVENLDESRTRLFKAVIEMLNWFAGKQIRSVGSIGSNIMTGSPISDLLPILIANEVTLELQSSTSRRSVSLDNNFFTGYRTSIVLPEEVLTAICIPFTNQDRYCYAYKQARRREDDIAIVNAAINVQFEQGSDIIQDINAAFGGMSFKTVTAVRTRQTLKGLPWNRTTLQVAYDCLMEDLPLDAGAPGGMISYRRSLTLSLFFKAFLAISRDLQLNIDPRELSGIEGFHTKEYKSAQYFTVVPENRDKNDPVQRPIVHTSSYKQATGEAVYCDDMPFVENEAYFAFVTSTKAHAKILKIDPTEALLVKGVYDFVSAKDIDKNRNRIGTIVHDEKVFYDEIVTCQGQFLGGIVAVDQFVAQKAARLVKVEYEEIEPVIVSMQDAIAKKSFLGKTPARVLVRGDCQKGLKESVNVLEGECQMGGQEHFYLETQCVLVVPKQESDEIEVFSSTQNPSEVGAMLAEVLGIPQNRIVCRVKRLGGGFGGKESKAMNVAIPVAIAAKKLNRPIRCMLDRDEDMVMTGARHPFMMKYKVGFDNDGKIQALDMKIYNNCGFSHDLSPSVLDRAVSHAENSYRIPCCRIEGYMCKTNLPSNTAFRGFGGPQGMYATECIVENIADFLRKDPAEVSHANLQQDGDLTIYNQQLSGNNLTKCWEECLQSSDYYARRKSVEQFNKDNKYKKRGICMVPTKYGIAFTALFLNQAGALVLIYHDGSVLLSHGGIEMGQGLYTKMIQVASKALEIPIEKIHTVETSTDKVPNTSPTAASAGSDLNGMAVLNACSILKERLEPFKLANPTGTWEEWVRSAYFSRVSLSATGFYKTPDIGYDWDTGKGQMFNYFTYGVACAEVEIDTLTGDHQVHRIDIVMDLGESLNPAIDIGQIEGAFMQGYGLFVLEEMVYSPSGTTYTRGPGTYKIPGFADIPAEFNVSLLKGSSNPRAVYSSKAVGEPPLFLGSAVLFAIKDAIRSCREENGLERNFTMDSPATCARIRMACQDGITSKFKEPAPGSYKPWNVVA